MALNPLRIPRRPDIPYRSLPTILPRVRTPSFWGAARRGTLLVSPDRASAPFPVDGDTSRPVISGAGINIAQRPPRFPPIGAYPGLLAKNGLNQYWRPRISPPPPSHRARSEPDRYETLPCVDTRAPERYISRAVHVAPLRPSRRPFPASVRLSDAGPRPLTLSTA